MHVMVPVRSNKALLHDCESLLIPSNKKEPHNTDIFHLDTLRDPGLVIGA